jgi:hypothetical protein
MQLHLLQCQIGDILTKRVRLNKLEMCMLVLEEFQTTYTMASIYRGIFTKAIQQIFPGYSAHTISPSHVALSIATPAAEQYVPASIIEGERLDTNNTENNELGYLEFAGTDETDLVDVFLDDTSVLTFGSIGTKFDARLNFSVFFPLCTLLSECMVIYNLQWNGTREEDFFDFLTLTTEVMRRC